MGSPVVWFEIGGEDPRQLAAFYGQLFGWKIDFENDMSYGLVDTAAGGKGIAGGIGGSQESLSRLTFYIEVEDPQAALESLERAGGKSVVPVTELPMATFALFADPEGNVVRLVKS